MSYIDITILVFAGLGFLFGLMGKAPKKIFSLIVVVAAVVTSYIAFGKVVDVIYGTSASSLQSVLESSIPQDVTIDWTTATIGDVLPAILGGMLADMGIPADSIAAMLTGVVNVLVFWIMTIVLLIAFGLVGKIISAILFHRAKKHTAFKTLGLFGAAKGAIIGLVVVLPVIAFSPILSNISGLISDNPELGATIEENVKSSKVVEYSDKYIVQTKDSDNKLQDPKFKLAFLYYGDNKYLYTDIKGLGSTASLVAKLGILSGGEGGEEVNPIESIMSMSNEDLTELLTSIGDSEVLSSVVGGVLEQAVGEETFDELGINVEEIDWSKEAGAIVLLKDAVMTEEGGMSESPNIGSIFEGKTEEEKTAAVDALCESALVGALVNMAGDMFVSDLPENATEEQVAQAKQEMVADLADEYGIPATSLDKLYTLFGVTKPEESQG